MKRSLSLLGAGLLGLAVAALGIPAAAQAGNAAAGKSVYMTNCFPCHGANGKGDGPVGQALNPRPRDFTKGQFKFDTDGDGKTGTDADLMNVIKNGAAKYGGSPLMAPWAQLPDQDIQNLVAFIRTFQKK